MLVLLVYQFSVKSYSITILSSFLYSSFPWPRTVLGKARSYSASFCITQHVSDTYLYMALFADHSLTLDEAVAIASLDISTHRPVSTIR